MVIELYNNKAVIVQPGNIDMRRWARQYLSCMYPGYEQSEKYRTWKFSCSSCDYMWEAEISYKCPQCSYGSVNKEKRLWDGKYSFLKRDNSFPQGLLPFMVVALDKKGVATTIKDMRTKAIQKVTPQRTIGNITLRDYQYEEMLVPILEAGFSSLYWPSCIVDAATNSGKTYVMAALIEHWKRYNGVLLVHRQLLFKQLCEMFKELGISYSQFGLGKHEVGPFTIAMVKTLANKLKKSINLRHQLEHVNYVLVEECHTAKTKDHEYIFDVIRPFATVGFSGTPLDHTEDKDRLTIVGRFGPRACQITNQYLIDKMVSQKPKITILKYRQYYNSKHSYHEQYETMKTSVNRNKWAIELAQNAAEKPTLILVKYKDHGKYLHKLLLQNTQAIVEHLDGDTPKKDADQILDRFNSGRSHILVASLVIQEGLNLKRIQQAINMTGTEGKIVLKQGIIGRSVRHDGVNDNVEIYDFYDHGKMLKKASEKRIEHYEAEGFKIERRPNKI